MKEATEPPQDVVVDENLNDLLGQNRDKMRRMVQLRMDRRLRGRIDASDVVQEAYIEASRRYDEYTANPKMPFNLWLRFLTNQKLVQLHRHHLGVQARDASLEISLSQSPMATVSSEAIAAHLVGSMTTPSQVVMRSECRVQVQKALNEMTAVDREILALCHFEQLSLSDSARLLGIKHSTACNRYVRALERLKGIMGEVSPL